MSELTLLLDEHVDRVFERLLRGRGFSVEQSKDRFGESTNDRELLDWCEKREVVFVTNNVKDFSRLHERNEHSGVLCYREQQLPKTDPAGLARTSKKSSHSMAATGSRITSSNSTSGTSGSTSSADSNTFVHSFTGERRVFAHHTPTTAQTWKRPRSSASGP